MTAELQNIEHKQGKYRKLKFGPIKNPRGELVSFAGASATWRMAKTASSTGADILIMKDSGSNGGIEITVADFYGVDAYTVEVTLDSEDTLDLPVCVPPNMFYHECEVTTIDGHPITVATGKFDLQPSITN